MEINKDNIIQIKKTRSKCPSCKKPALERFHPFCSKKCADLDLSKWLTDGQSVEINKD